MQRARNRSPSPTTATPTERKDPAIQFSNFSKMLSARRDLVKDIRDNNQYLLKPFRGGVAVDRYKVAVASTDSVATTVTDPSSPYPPAMHASTAKQKWHKWEFCNRIVRNLERHDENPAVWDPNRATSPPYSRVPPELRQHVLFDVLLLNEEEENLPNARPKSTPEQLSLVCKTFAADMKPVMRLWRVRENDMRAQGTSQAGSMFTSLIADFMNPIVASANVNRRCAALRPSRTKSIKRREKAWTQQKLNGKTGGVARYKATQARIPPPKKQPGVREIARKNGAQETRKDRIKKANRARKDREYDAVGAKKRSEQQAIKKSFDALRRKWAEEKQ